MGRNFGFSGKRVKSRQECIRRKMHSKMPSGAGLTDLQNHKMDSTKRYFHIGTKRKENALLRNQPKKTNQMDHDQYCNSVTLRVSSCVV